jgi:tetraacyldisaccharide 4'-kinase
MVTGETYFRDLVDGKRRSPLDRAVFALLLCCSLPYAAVMAARALLYRWGVLSSRRLPRPVISVGNIVVGGTGKTPMTAWIAAYLMGKGKRVAVLTRGYGGMLEGQVAIVSDGSRRLLGPLEAGDEPCLLADLLPGLIVVMGSDRYRAGCLAMERFRPDVFILDDGFQHLRLQRDLDIVLLDATRPKGNGHTFPAGLLREPFSAVGRAHLAVFTRSDGSDPAGIILPKGLPRCHARHQLTGFTAGENADQRSFSELAGRRGLAFAGIADPDGFFNALEEVGVVLAATLAFPDHSTYGEEECAALARLKKSCRADFLITTAKDGVKLATASTAELPFYVARLDMAFHDPVPLQTALDKLL